MERGLLRHVLDAVQKFARARPADFDSAEEISLRARHLEQPLRIELGLGAENLRVGPEAHLGAAAVGDLAELFQPRFRLAALIDLPIELAAARDLDLHALRQRVGDRHADAVEAARGAVDLAVELAARVQRAHDHFERGFFREFRMRVDRDAAAVVGHAEEAVGGDLDLDEMGVTGERLVHGIVDHLGKQVVQRLLVGAADIHAGAPAHRLEPFQHLDVTRGVGTLSAPSAPRRFGHGLGTRAAARGRGQFGEQVAGAGSGFFGDFGCGFCHGLSVASEHTGGEGTPRIKHIDYATAVAGS